MVNVQELPNTPPLNRFGGEFENGWEFFFQDLNGHLQQLQSVYKVDSSEIYVNRNGSIVTVSGSFGKTKKSVGVRPVCAMTFLDGILKLNANGEVYLDSGYDGTSVATSITFIARD